MDTHRRQDIRTLDLFAGCGGSSWGARQAGAKIVAAVDIRLIARDTFVDNFPDVQFYAQPVDDIDPMRLEGEVGQIDLILASPECTSHTCAKGNGVRSEDSRLTAFDVIRFARALRPRWLVIENVIHMRSWDRYSEFLSILREELAYHLRVQILNAKDFGVPQSRKRLFILCDKKMAPPEVVSEPTAPIRLAKHVVDVDGQYAFSPLVTSKRAKRTLEHAERAISQLGRDKPFLIVYYGTDGGGGWQRLESPLRTVTTIDRFAYVKPSQGNHVMRMLQVPEIKVAMGFPNDFMLNHGTRRDKIYLLGNAVCPPVMLSAVRTLTRAAEGDP